MLLAGEIFFDGIGSKFTPNDNQKYIYAPRYIKNAIYLLKNMSENETKKNELYTDSNTHRTMSLIGEGAADVIQQLDFEKISSLSTEQLKAICFCKNSKVLLKENNFSQLLTLTPEQILTWATLRLSDPDINLETLIKLSPGITNTFSSLILRIGYHANLGISINDLQDTQPTALKNLLLLIINNKEYNVSDPLLILKVIKTNNDLNDLSNSQLITFEAIALAANKNYGNTIKILGQYTIAQINEALENFGIKKFKNFASLLEHKDDEKIKALLKPPEAKPNM
jgi:hypothetical protein